MLTDVGRIVERRMKWIGEWRKMTYEKVWIKGVEWTGEMMDARLEDL